ncbi:MAG: AEC family transporter [Candidatus Omnitrophica bacterium]|nr:AEC family transporter [Candidatus Omnitrophota bacterium]MDD5553580.1 AEC family transporter [Candidatus Omnitrophota bacterium]
MFLESFKVTGTAVAQIFFLGALGYFLIRKKILAEEGLNALSELVIDVTLPLMIFSQLIKDFSFSLYPDWWIFPLISIAVTVTGLIVGFAFMGFIGGGQKKLQFLNLVAFQNSGYLPIPLVAAFLAPDKLSAMFIYIFLFLLGFNLVMFSVGLYILSYAKNGKFKMMTLLNPPVFATLASLALIFLGLNKFIPETVLSPMRMMGNCTVPLAMLVVGANLAMIRLRDIDAKAMLLLASAKLIILPALGLLFITKFRIPELIGLLIILQLAVPSATNLSVIIRSYKKEDLLISQGVFVTHLGSIVTLPLFLSLYFTLKAW